MYQGTGPAPRYYQSAAGQAASAMPRGDREIRDAVLQNLSLDSWVNDKDISVEVKGGVVVLNGEVDTANEKRAAGDDAWDTPGVIDVVNDLRVRNLEPLARQRRQVPQRGQASQTICPT